MPFSLSVRGENGGLFNSPEAAADAMISRASPKLDKIIMLPVIAALRDGDWLEVSGVRCTRERSDDLDSGDREERRGT